MRTQMVEPTNLKPRLARSLLMASDSSGGRHVLSARQRLLQRASAANCQIYRSKLPTSLNRQERFGILTAARTFEAVPTIPSFASETAIWLRRSLRLRGSTRSIAPR